MEILSKERSVKAERGMMVSWKYTYGGRSREKNVSARDDCFYWLLEDEAGSRYGRQQQLWRSGVKLRIRVLASAIKAEFMGRFWDGVVIIG
ncbi:hypothetical protein GCM10011507_00400 [Edaphobacter acidisoli]|uniref:Uncharacterized protein n=1 Tax=Edaphobacter acidisoli TaxID=2040573 RepID=A0A916RE38_9BACT|nr:hypothetical protein GCM10011507_00400 [Edaphobacter acidisoli]